MSKRAGGSGEFRFEKIIRVTLTTTCSSGARRIVLSTDRDCFIVWKPIGNGKTYNNQCGTHVALMSPRRNSVSVLLRDTNCFLKKITSWFLITLIKRSFDVLTTCSWIVKTRRVNRVPDGNLFYYNRNIVRGERSE